MKKNTSRCFCQQIVQGFADLAHSHGFCHVDENLLEVIEHPFQNQEHFGYMAQKQKHILHNQSSPKLFSHFLESSHPIDQNQNQKLKIKIKIDSKSLSYDKYRKTSECKMAQDIMRVLLLGRWRCHVLSFNLQKYNVDLHDFIEKLFEGIFCYFIRQINSLNKFIQNMHNENSSIFLELKSKQCEQESKVSKRNNFHPTIHFETKYAQNNTTNHNLSFQHKKREDLNEKSHNQRSDKYQPCYHTQKQIQSEISSKRIKSPVFQSKFSENISKARNNTWNNKTMLSPLNSPTQQKVKFALQILPADKKKQCSNNIANQSRIETKLEQGFLNYKRQLKNSPTLIINNPNHQTKAGDTDFIYKPLPLNSMMPSSRSYSKNFTYHPEKQCSKNSNNSSQNLHVKYQTFLNNEKTKDCQKLRNYANCRKDSLDESLQYTMSKTNAKSKTFIRKDSTACPLFQQKTDHIKAAAKKMFQIPRFIRKQSKVDIQQKTRSNKYVPNFFNPRLGDIDSQKNSYAQQIGGSEAGKRADSFFADREFHIQSKSNRQENGANLKKYDSQLSESNGSKKKRNSICHQVNTFISGNQINLNVTSQKQGNKQQQTSKFKQTVSSNNSGEIYKLEIGENSLDQEELSKDHIKEDWLKNQSPQILKNLVNEQKKQNRKTSFHHLPPLPEQQQKQLKSYAKKSHKPITLENDSVIEQFPNLQQLDSITQNKKDIQEVEKVDERPWNNWTPNGLNQKKSYTAYIWQKKKKGIINNNVSYNFQNRQSLNKKIDLNSSLKKNPPKNYSKESNDRKNISKQRQFKRIQDAFIQQKKKRENLINKYLKSKRQNSQEKISKSDKFQANKSHLNLPEVRDEINQGFEADVQNNRTNKSYSNLNDNKGQYLKYKNSFKAFEKCLQQKKNPIYRKQSTSTSSRDKYPFYTKQQQAQKKKANQKYTQESYKELQLAKHKSDNPKNLTPLLNEQEHKQSSESFASLALSRKNISPLKLQKRDIPNEKPLFAQTEEEKKRAIFQSQRIQKKQKDLSYQDWKFRLDSGVKYDIKDKVAYKNAKFSHLKAQALKLLA